MGKKIVIIGSGIGGSGIGALITKETPHQVSCFEQSKIIGGRCGSYDIIDDKERTWLFDVGCHIFSTCEKGPLGEMLDRCGKNLEWSPTKNPGPRVNVMGMELSKVAKDNQKKNKPKEEKKSFKDFLKTTSVEEASKYDDMTLTDLLDDFFGKSGGAMDRMTYSMQAGVCFGTTPETTSAGEFIRSIGDNFRKISMGYPKGGGTGIIPELYCDAIKENGGQLFFGKQGRVAKIIVEDNCVKGVEVGADRKFYEADIIIANSDIKTTVLKLVGEEYFSKEYTEHVKDLKWGGQVCSLKIGIDKIITDHKMLTYVPTMAPEDMQAMFAGASGDKSDSNKIERKVPKKTPLLIVPISNHDPALAPEGCQNIHTVTPTAMGESSKWSVEDEKKWEKSCLDTLLELWPDIEDHIVVKDFISTSILDARFGKEGAGTGTAQSIDQVGKNRPSVISPIKGLYYSSGDAGGWGIGTELAGRSALELFEILKENDFSNNKIFNR